MGLEGVDSSARRTADHASLTRPPGAWRIRATAETRMQTVKLASSQFRGHDGFDKSMD
jgi:hypothetical protein